MMTLQGRINQSDLVNLPDWQIANILNEPDPALPLKRQPVNTLDSQVILLQSGDWPKIILASDDTNLSSEIRGLAITLRDTIRQAPTIEAQKSEIYTAVSQTLDALVFLGLITNQSKVDLLALAERPQSWAEYNQIEVTARTVGLARGNS